ncbi:MAG: GntR family transcriptional regulator [Pseudomonadota bacterium]
MTLTLELPERKTGSDHVFETLFGQIVRLELLPGTKMSETETAKAFGCSRQPVREAFMRLANLNLLLIRPQRATIVRPFSREIIANARFVRAAVEFEVVRAAAENLDQSVEADIRANMRAQRDAITRADAEAFHDLDYKFHQLLCNASGKGFAFDIIAANKAQVDRLCMLSLTSKEAMETLYADHQDLLDALAKGDAEAAVCVLRAHLDRLTPTIEALHTTHRSYFEF